MPCNSIFIIVGRWFIRLIFTIIYLNDNGAAFFTWGFIFVPFLWKYICRAAEAAWTELFACHFEFFSPCFSILKYQTFPKGEWDHVFHKFIRTRTVGQLTYQRHAIIFIDLRLSTVITGVRYASAWFILMHNLGCKSSLITNFVGRRVKIAYYYSETEQKKYKIYNPYSILRKFELKKGHIHGRQGNCMSRKN
jgi:hypothetical protein